MGLLNLPLEVILCIADFLNNWADIWSFAHTTSRFHELLARHTIWRFRYMLLNRAIIRGWGDLLEKVLQTNIDINMASEFLNWHPPLSLAIHHGHTAIVGALLQESNIDVHCRGRLWAARFPLQQATMDGKICIMKLLLSHANMDVVHASEALWTAVEKKNTQALQTLLQHDVNANQHRDDGSLLAYALRSRDMSAVRLLVADKRTDLDILYKESEYTVFGQQSGGAVHIILELMTKLSLDDLTVLWRYRTRFTLSDTLDNGGNTALHLMTRWGHLQWCQTLCEEYPEMLFMANKEGHVPLSIALDRSMTDFCELFGRCNAACYQTPDVAGEVPLMRVIRMGYLDLFRRLQLHEPIKEQLIHSRGRNGTTTLMEAIKHRRQDIVKDLITLGVDPNISDGAGYTPLILAVRQRNTKCVEMLVNLSNIDINKHDSLGWNALIWAKRARPKSRVRSRGTFERIEELLVDRGATAGLLLDNDSERNEWPPGKRMWLMGPRRGTLRRRALI